MIPIHIESEQIKSMKTITAHAVDKIGGKVKVAKMELRVPEKGTHATLTHVKVESKFRKKGIASGMFNHALEELGSQGKKFVRSDALIHPAQVSIRARKQTKFIGSGIGIHGDQTKKLGKLKAYESVSKINKGFNIGANDPVNVKATTMIPKKFRRTK